MKNDTDMRRVGIFKWADSYKCFKKQCRCAEHAYDLAYCRRWMEKMNLFELCKDFCISTVYTVDYDEIGMPDICHESVLCNKDSFKAQVAKYNLACMEHDEALKNYSQCRAEFREFIINSFFGFFRTKKA